MQDCFRAHPEMYASELEDDEDEVEEELRAREAASSGDENPSKPEPSAQASAERIPRDEPKKPAEEAHRDSSSTAVGSAETSGDEGGELLPKSVHDATAK